MGLLLACTCSLRALAATVVAIVAGVADAGSWQSMPLFAGGGLPSGVEVAKVITGDTWVDLHITSNAPALCKSLRDCKGNGSSSAHGDVAGSKMQMLVADVEDMAPQSGVTRAAAGHQQEPLAMETQALALSLLLKQRRAKSTRELRPVTITFGETHAPKRVRDDLSTDKASLITSLAHFGLSFA
eukprot:TRINITY_DN36363_c0_g1_i1.p1 TRINITY_DN36363_c0_g1~~TRINITY_DN36363_c0_g1_i1.p1  ORF type:complete len:185 (-),score=31.77 TRINITY_DN36363_c0_g1_i1:565-1119(-)